jgi:cardiolipin synthase C
VPRGGCSGAAGITLLLALLISGCASLPPIKERSPVIALAPDESGPVSQVLVPLTQEHPGKSGVALLADGRVAFAVRVHLARQAAKSIDIQTYIWHEDATGTLLYEEMMQAARRGVRVRILLDDANATRKIDPILTLLAREPNVEVRLYNPFIRRGSKAIGFLTEFERLNHRMHNKSFTVDNRVTIVGGRNVADEYFEADNETGLVDLDAVAVGEVVQAVSAEFDLYWNSPSAYAATQILANVKPLTAEELRQRAQDVIASPKAAVFAEAVAQTEQVQQLLTRTLDIQWTTAHVINDDPAKTLQPVPESEVQLLPKLRSALGDPQSSLDLISPYFVPGPNGSAALEAIARRGVKVRVLTNSLAATDVSSVHAGYSKYRVRLLQAGVQLYELKRDAVPIEKRAKQIGSSATAGLHAKTYAADQSKIFVGSFNLDPRSSKLNTEMGMVIDCPTLAARLAQVVDNAFPDIAYRVTLTDGANLKWEDGTKGETYTTEPETGWFRRVSVRVQSWLPIDWLL